MNYEREEYMRRQDAEHEMIAMRDYSYRPRLPVFRQASVPGLTPEQIEALASIKLEGE